MFSSMKELRKRSDFCSFFPSVVQILQNLFKLYISIHTRKYYIILSYWLIFNLSNFFIYLGIIVGGGTSFIKSKSLSLEDVLAGGGGNETLGLITLALGLFTRFVTNFAEIILLLSESICPVYFVNFFGILQLQRLKN